MLGELVDGTTKLTAHGRCNVSNERGVAQDVGVEDYGYDEPDDEPRNGAVPCLRLSALSGEGGAEEEWGDQRQDHYPQGAGKLDGGGNLKGTHALSDHELGMHLVVCRSCSNNGGGVVYGYGCPHAKLLHRHAQGIANGRKQKQSDAVEHKHHAQRH